MTAGARAQQPFVIDIYGTILLLGSIYIVSSLKTEAFSPEFGSEKLEGNFEENEWNEKLNVRGRDT